MQNPSNENEIKLDNIIEPKDNNDINLLDFDKPIDDDDGGLVFDNGDDAQDVDEISKSLEKSENSTNRRSTIQ